MFEQSSVETTCERKATFVEQVARERARATGLRAYECPVCANWHLSSQGISDEDRERAKRGERKARARRRRRKAYR